MQQPRVSGEQLQGLAQNLQSLEQQLDSLPQPGALQCITALLCDRTEKLQFKLAAARACSLRATRAMQACYAEMRV